MSATTSISSNTIISPIPAEKEVKPSSSKALKDKIFESETYLSELRARNFSFNHSIQTSYTPKSPDLMQQLKDAEQQIEGLKNEVKILKALGKYYLNEIGKLQTQDPTLPLYYSMIGK